MAEVWNVHAWFGLSSSTSVIPWVWLPRVSCLHLSSGPERTHMEIPEPHQQQGAKTYWKPPLEAELPRQGQLGSAELQPHEGDNQCLLFQVTEFGVICYITLLYQ